MKLRPPRRPKSNLSAQGRIRDLNKKFDDCLLCTDCQKNRFTTSETDLLVICDEDHDEVFTRMVDFSNLLILPFLTRTLHTGAVRVHSAALGRQDKSSLVESRNCEPVFKKFLFAMSPRAICVVGADAAKKWNLQTSAFPVSMYGRVVPLRGRDTFLFSNFMAYQLKEDFESVNFLRDTIGKEFEAFQNYLRRKLRR